MSLWITTRADRLGRKRMLIAGAALMLLGGLVFAVTGNFRLLLLAATIGVLSPSGNEVGPFLAIEQAALAETVAAAHRTRVFAWYQLAGSFATAAGSLACGVVVQLLQGQAVRPLRQVGSPRRLRVPCPPGSVSRPGPPRPLRRRREPQFSHELRTTGR